MRDRLKNLFHQREKKPALPLVRYLVYLLIVTTTITGVSLSRYASSDWTEDAARVGKFDVSVTPSGWSNHDIASHQPGGSQQYAFTVKNNSEVAVRARLINADTGNPMTVSVTNTSSQAVPVDSNGWFAMTPGGTSGDTRLATTAITGTPFGVVTKMYIEYEQID